MFKEYEYILPLIGVIIGWVLTEISHYFQNRKQDRKIIREAVYAIIDLKFRLEQEARLLKAAVESDLSNNQNNRMISAFLENEKDGFDKINSDLEASVKIVASIDPFIALELRIAVNENLYTSNYDLAKDEEIKKLYLESQLKISELFSIYLHKTLKKILWKADKMLFLRYYIQKKKTIVLLILYQDFFIKNERYA
jgi:hypothetical protein